MTMTLRRQLECHFCGRPTLGKLQVAAAQSLSQGDNFVPACDDYAACAERRHARIENRRRRVEHYHQRVVNSRSRSPVLSWTERKASA